MTAAVLDGALVASAKTHRHATPATAQDAPTTAPSGHSRKATQKAAPDADSSVDTSARVPRRGKHATAQKSADDAPAAPKRGSAAATKAAKDDAPAVKRDKHGRVIAQKATDDSAPAVRSRNKKSSKSVAKADDAPTSDVPAAKPGKRSRAQQAQAEDAPPTTRRGKHARVVAQQAKTDDAPPPVVPARKRGRKAGGYEDGYRDGYAAALAQLRSGQSMNTALPPLPRGTSPKSNRVSTRALSDDSGIPAGPAVGTELLEKTSFDVRGAMPAPLKGSTASLVRQNTRLIDDGLERIEDDHDLESRIAHKLLVPVPTSSMLSINQDIPLQRRYCRPWTARFLADLARLHYDAFRRPLIVSSAVRTVDYQKRLMGVNGNAARAEGDIVSPHLTGAAIDLPKEIFSRQEMAWMRSKLAALQDAGKIDVEEEFQQTCFHITVYKNYVARPGEPDSATSVPERLNANAGQ